MSWRVSFRFTPFLHMRLPSVACAPPLANSRPCCAFHAQISMRVSGRPAQPGFALVGGVIIGIAVFAGAAVPAGSSTLGGTDDGAAAWRVPPNRSGMKCLVANPALASSAAPIKPLESGVSPLGRVVVVMVSLLLAAV